MSRQLNNIARTLRRLLVMLPVAGCADGPPPANIGTSTPGQPALRNGAEQPAPGAPRQAVQLDIFQIRVPRGAISNSAEFWKRVDENQVDPPTYRLLLKNGLRVGVAPAGEWEYFRNIIEQYPAKTDRSNISAGAAGGYDISLREKVASENLFYFDAQDRLRGRTFEDCENLFAVAFQSAPRQPDSIRLKICPVIRGLRRRYEITLRNDEREVRFVHPEQLYDLNLEALVAPNSFFVLGPSAQAASSMSVGGLFLIQDTPAEQLETVLLFAPRSIPLERATPDGTPPLNRVPPG